MLFASLVAFIPMRPARVDGGPWQDVLRTFKQLREPIVTIAFINAEIAEIAQNTLCGLSGLCVEILSIATVMNYSG